MTYALARAFASLPTGRVPIVPASIVTCERAFCSENRPALRVQPASAGKRTSRRKKQGRWRIGASVMQRRLLDQPEIPAERLELELRAAPGAQIGRDIPARLSMDQQRNVAAQITTEAREFNASVRGRRHARRDVAAERFSLHVR